MLVSSGEGIRGRVVDDDLDLVGAAAQRAGDLHSVRRRPRQATVDAIDPNLGDLPNRATYSNPLGGANQAAL